MSAPVVTPADAERLVKVLEASSGWLTAAAIANALFGKVNEQTKRRVRAIANAAGDAIVSYRGSPGYRLWTHCTVDELHTCVAAWDAQIQDMRLRRDLFRRRLYRSRPATITSDPELRPAREQLAFL